MTSRTFACVVAIVSTQSFDAFDGQHPSVQQRLTRRGRGRTLLFFVRQLSAASVSE